MINSFTALKRVTPLAAFFLLLLTAGCAQDPIFDYISGETAPTNPIINGSPSKMARAAIGGKEKLYVANGSIWEYDLDPQEPSVFWSRSPKPAGYVTDVASVSGASGDVLYAFAVDDNTATAVWENSGNGWTELDPPDDYGFIQNIFGAGDALFATGAKEAGDAYDYAILYKDSSGFRVVEEIGKAFLTGAGKADGAYYLAAQGKGIYRSSDSGALLTLALETPTPSVPSDIVGLLQAGQDVIIGISKGGYILRIDDAGLSVDPASLGGTYSGALALMVSPAPQDGYDSLLLLGYKTQSSSYQQGYMELQYNSVSGTHDGTPRIPGEDQPSSVSDYRQYDSSLRRYPVTSLWALPPAQAGEPSVIFAATTNQGLYSYRDRSDGGWQWNHEE